MSQPAAEAAIAAAGLAVGASTMENSDTVPSGNVISQSPSAGISVPENSTVDLVISLGPSLDSITLAPATATLTTIGETLQLAVTGNYSDGSTRDITLASGGTIYNLSDSSIISITTNGLVAALAEGVSTVTAANSGKTASAVITVDATPPALQFTSPTQGEALNTQEVAVTGTVDDPGDTSISGVVSDNSNVPIPDVTVRVEGTTRQAVTDAQGQFVILNVPVGPVHLIADGSTAGGAGIEYPVLSYDMVTVSGADNKMSMPIYMLPLDISNAETVGGNEDVVYTVDGVPGFSLTVKANSVTFPDGSTTGQISVTQVNADKVPMVPQMGQQPRFIITIQPPGAIFDPPAPITLPNVDGLSPGEKTNLYSFDHDLGMFVSIGTGTVSEDGMVVASDLGVGVVKAGWHCGGNPSSTGSTANCGDCKVCEGGRCISANENGSCVYTCL